MRMRIQEVSYIADLDPLHRWLPLTDLLVEAPYALVRSPAHPSQHCQTKLNGTNKHGKNKNHEKLTKLLTNLSIIMTTVFLVHWLSDLFISKARQWEMVPVSFNFFFWSDKTCSSTWDLSLYFMRTAKWECTRNWFGRISGMAGNWMSCRTGYPSVEFNCKRFLRHDVGIRNWCHYNQTTGLNIAPVLVPGPRELIHSPLALTPLLVGSRLDSPRFQSQLGQRYLTTIILIN